MVLDFSSFVYRKTSKLKKMLVCMCDDNYSITKFCIIQESEKYLHFFAYKIFRKTMYIEINGLQEWIENS